MSYWVNLIEESADSNVEENGRIVNTYNRTYQYKTDSATRPTEVDIIDDIGIVLGSPYPNDLFATCKKVAIGPGPIPTRPPHLCYHVKYSWSTFAPQPNTVDTDPTTMRTVWSLKPSIQSRYVIKDRHGNLILNAAGQPFDGGIPVDVRLGGAVAKKNRPASGYDQNAVLANSGKVNSDTFLGGAPGTVQVDIEADEVFEGAYHYWSETYRFSYDPLGWQPKPVDAGFFYINSFGELRRIRNSDVGDTTDESFVNEPEPLRADGSIVPLSLRPASCRFVAVDYFEAMDFTSLNL